MSFHKCFYCEKKLKGGVRHQVEHYRDVADRPDLSFEWSNLYLTCEDCNLGKPSNADLPVEVCLDPCGKIAPSRHLRFDDEIVTAVHFPKPEKGAYVKFPNPASRYSMVGVFVAKVGGAVRVAVTGAGPCAFRWTDAETALAGSFAPAAIDGLSIDPGSLNGDMHGSAEYRAHLIKVIAKRAVEAAA